MALSAKVGTVALNTGTGAQAVTGVGFQPKALIVFGVTLTATGYSQALSQWFGFSDGTLSFCVARSADDAAASSNTGHAYYNNLAIILTGGTPTVDGVVSLTSFDAGGFTLNIDDAPASAWVMGYLALGGASLSVKAGVHNLATAGATQAFTGVGFVPEALLRISAGRGVDADYTNFGGIISIGAATSAAQTWATGVADRDGRVTMEVAAYQRSDRSYVGISGNANAVDTEHTLLTFDADGWTDTINDLAPAAVRMPYLAMRGVNFRAGVETQKTSTGTKVTSGLGFTPFAALFVGTNKVASATLDQTNNKVTIGASDGTNEVSVWADSVDNIADSQIAQSLVTTKAMRFSSADATTDAEADVTFASDTFTADWTTADATAREFGYFVIGEVVAALTVIPTVNQAPLIPTGPSFPGDYPGRD